MPPRPFYTSKAAVERPFLLRNALTTGVYPSHIDVTRQDVTMAEEDTEFEKKEASAKALGVSVRTVDRYLKERMLTPAKIGKRGIRVTVASRKALQKEALEAGKTLARAKAD
jgi:hypothetical protein